jgi:hypothetical protein
MFLQNVLRFVFFDGAVVVFGKSGVRLLKSRFSKKLSLRKPPTTEAFSYTGVKTRWQRVVLKV